MGTEKRPNQPSELFWPPVALNRSAVSRAETKILYSGDVSRRSGGPGDRLGLYIRTEHILPERPDQILVMAYRQRPADTSGATVVKRLVLHAPERYAHASKVRYRDLSDAIGDVYFPRKLLGDAPEEIYLEIKKKSGTPISAGAK